VIHKVGVGKKITVYKDGVTAYEIQVREVPA
jgi:hypothetical protein